MSLSDNATHFYVNPTEFYDNIRTILDASKSNEYAILSIDFDNFNYINDLFSYSIGNSVLQDTIVCIDNDLGSDEYFTKLHADHYILLIKNQNVDGSIIDNVSRFCKLVNSKKYLSKTLPSYYNLVCSGGIVPIIDTNDSLPTLLDKANFARKRAKGNHSNTIFTYTPQMQIELEWQKTITVIMRPALDAREFEMYLQPLVLVKTGQLVGAEALVRWNNKDRGMIYPDKFIPILERNGFIKELDFFMLEEACKFLIKCQKDGLPILPISVNFSKTHVSTVGFAHNVYQVVSSYGVSPHYIELEMTESAMSEDFSTLLEIITTLKGYGFKVALDDFGSAYSSLNHLKKLPFDVVKIDKEFFSDSENQDNCRIIIAKIIELIKSLRMVAVMEGVETEEQVGFLTKLCCDIGQGYVYAKPMPANQYYDLLKHDKNVASFSNDTTPSPTESFQNAVAREFIMDNWELYVLGKNIDMGLMKGSLDGELIAEYVNDKALEYFGYTRQEFSDLFSNKILPLIHVDDVDTFMNDIIHLKKIGSSISFKLRAIKRDGSTITIEGKSSCVNNGVGGLVGVFAFRDVTDELEKTNELVSEIEEKAQMLEEFVSKGKVNEEALTLSEKKYQLIMELSEDIMFEWDFLTDKIQFSDKYFIFFGMQPIIDDISTSTNLRDLIHPDDTMLFEYWINETYRKSGITESEFRLKNGNGIYLWLKVRSISVNSDNGMPIKAIGVFTNISKQKNELNEMARKAQLDPLTKIYNKEESRRLIEAILEKAETRGAFCVIDIDNFKGINDNLGHQFGDTVLKETAKKISSAFRGSDIVGRLGGDEFIVYVNDINDIASFNNRLSQLLIKLHSSYIGKSAVYKLSASIGVAIFPDQGKVFDELYRKSDLALYHSKRNGKSKVSTYSDDFSQTMEFISAESRIDGASHRVLSSYFEDDFIYNIFELLYETKEIKATVEKVLELAGKRFFVDRVYIFEISEDGQYLNNTYEWCGDNIGPEIATLQNLPIEEYSAFFGSLNHDGFLCCNDIKLMDKVTFETCDRQNIKSFLHCMMYENEKKIGFIGFDICKNTRIWKNEEIAILAYLSKVLSTFIAKNRDTDKLIQNMELNSRLIDNLNGFVYVINKNYELLYVNEATKQYDINVGEKCYIAAFGSDHPCDNCPTKFLSESNQFETREIYSTKLNTWVNSAASRLKWGNNQLAALICCTDINKYKQ